MKNINNQIQVTTYTYLLDNETLSVTNTFSNEISLPSYTGLPLLTKTFFPPAACLNQPVQLHYHYAPPASYTHNETYLMIQEPFFGAVYKEFVHIASALIANAPCVSWDNEQGTFTFDISALSPQCPIDITFTLTFLQDITLICNNLPSVIVYTPGLPATALPTILTQNLTLNAPFAKPENYNDHHYRR